MFKPVKIVLVGCGGIGSWVSGPLMRFLNAERYTAEIHVWDGDRYALSNQTRQEFAAQDLGLNKAEALVQAVQANYRGLRLVAHPEFIVPDNVREAISERSIILSAVDNHPARALIEKQALGLNHIAVLSAGNERYDGNVHVLLRKNARNLTEPLLTRHPEIARMKSGDRASMGCEDLIEEGQTQLLVTNFVAAAALMTAFYQLWTLGHSSGHRRIGKLPQEIFFDVSAPSMSMVPAP